MASSARAHMTDRPTPTAARRRCRASTATIIILGSWCHAQMIGSRRAATGCPKGGTERRQGQTRIQRRSRPHHRHHSRRRRRRRNHHHHYLSGKKFLDRHRCKGCGFFRCQCAGSALESSSDHDSDAYELDRERMLEEQGRISSIHGRPWREVPSASTFSNPLVGITSSNHSNGSSPHLSGNSCHRRSARSRLHLKLQILQQKRSSCVRGSGGFASMVMAVNCQARHGMSRTMCFTFSLGFSN